METIIHFIDVGQGNMVLIEACDEKKIVFDCNITNDNESRVLNYVASVIGLSTRLHAFICSHRDADHMRGVKKLHNRFPINKIWDSDYPGTSTDTPEYREYMDLRSQVGSVVIKKKTIANFGRTRLRYMSAQDDRLPDNANAQGIVIKVEHRSNDGNTCLDSAMLPGDSDAQTWRNAIMLDYEKLDVSSSILMAAHHGSISFFDDPNDEQHYYTAHMEAISPAMTIISVGPNVHGHPDKKAIELYEKYSTGSDKGNKVYRTDQKGTMQLTLKDEGSWNLTTSK